MTSTTFALRLLGAAALTALAACQSTGIAFKGSPEGVPITVDIIDGAPNAVKTAFASEIVSAAAKKKVDLVPADDQARYRVLGHLSTETGADGEPVLAVVWDVVDADKRRAKRITGSTPIRSASAASDGNFDKETLAKLAATSMDEIAGFLAETKSGAIVTADASGRPGPALGFASQ
jgi:hypothetical protein